MGLEIDWVSLNCKYRVPNNIERTIINYARQQFTLDRLLVLLDRQEFIIILVYRDNWAATSSNPRRINRCSLTKDSSHTMNHFNGRHDYLLRNFELASITWLRHLKFPTRGSSKRGNPKQIIKTAILQCVFQYSHPAIVICLFFIQIYAGGVEMNIRIFRRLP